MPLACASVHRRLQCEFPMGSSSLASGRRGSGTVQTRCGCVCRREASAAADCLKNTEHLKEVPQQKCWTTTHAPQKSAAIQDARTSTEHRLISDGCRLSPNRRRLTLR